MPTQPHPNDLRDLYIKLNPNGCCDEDLEKDSLGFVDPPTSQDLNSFRAGHQAGQEDSERLGAERDALQQRLNSVEEENDRLRSALQAASKDIVRHQAEQPMSRRLAGLLTKARTDIRRALEAKS